MFILSLFPGIDMLGSAFESEGFCVVRGPDLIFGGDIRFFHPPSGKFDGIIGGPPCQDFSKARRGILPTGHGEEMLREYMRCVTEAKPDWWLMENVERVPNVTIPGYVTQRIDLNVLECGSNQNRLRHFQFGTRDGIAISPQRQSLPANSRIEPCATATEGRRGDRRSWGDFCEIQGLPRDFTLPSFTVEAGYRAVGNGVPLQMGRVMARAIKIAMRDSSMRDSSMSHTCESPAQSQIIRDATIGESRLCICGCGRRLTGRSDQKCATAGCRKRIEIQGKRPRRTIHASMERS